MGDLGAGQGAGAGSEICWPFAPKQRLAAFSPAVVDERGHGRHVGLALTDHGAGYYAARHAVTGISCAQLARTGSQGMDLFYSPPIVLSMCAFYALVS